jgi:Cu/Ag efflux pump CusA
LSERFQPILTTAITTALVVLPFVAFGDVAGLEIAHPTAVVILGGLVTSTLYSLVGMPALYARFASAAPTDELALTPETV